MRKGRRWGFLGMARPILSWRGGATRCCYGRELLSLIGTVPTSPLFVRVNAAVRGVRPRQAADVPRHPMHVARKTDDPDRGRVVPPLQLNNQLARHMAAGYGNQIRPTRAPPCTMPDRSRLQRGRYRRRATATCAAVSASRTAPAGSVRERLPAGRDVEVLCRRAPKSSLTTTSDDGAVGVAEGDVPGVAGHGGVDADGARTDEPRHVPGGRSSRQSASRAPGGGVDRDDAEARVAAAVVRPAGGVEGEVPGDDRSWPSCVTAPTVRKRVCQCRVSGNVVAGSPDSEPEHSVK